ncbi:hypothetical protein [Methylacidiphilum caldifontis]|uniref:Succinate dehydrogenase n=1 Tax=Methylacidiphilum caldifontis TaxID=2795386 RepID=A0A4Y8PB65_9BACT|nr:hypothetical protein [Methylacidiphilum caldifontis]QSR88204.1 hypothetical protein IT6_07380 [Methylacidiphilum caldifontis]TFE68243.1 hypothetical protein A7Q10_00965 [Methylacidiphilum caldifontis]
MEEALKKSLGNLGHWSRRTSLLIAIVSLLYWIVIGFSELILRASGSETEFSSALIGFFTFLGLVANFFGILFGGISFSSKEYLRPSCIIGIVLNGFFFIIVLACIRLF